MFPAVLVGGLLPIALPLLLLAFGNLGVSMTIHWFSDFLAGMIIGTVIGNVVGKSLLRSQNEAISSLSHDQR